MSKNVVIFFASPYRNEAKASIYTDTSGEFTASCTQTNETALKYIGWKLKQAGESIDAAYAFATKAVCEHDFHRLVVQFQNEEYNINPIYFDESSTIDGSFHSINILYQLLLKGYALSEETVIHMDLTGGFRHSTVLMLSLLRLLKYAGYKIGLITYTNFSEHRIETVNELVDMFDLISGADDFAHNGDVERLKNFFTGYRQSINLQKLLMQMEHFSECIKSCSKKEVLLETAKNLKNAITAYKISLQDITGNISAQEELFAKLLPLIEKEYVAIFNCNNTTESIPKLIIWCLKKNLLQQAATYATELIPVYLIESNLITIEKDEVESSSRKGCTGWANWQVQFLKNYQCKETSVVAESQIEKKESVSTIDYPMLRVLLDQKYSASALKKIVGNRNVKLSAFLTKVDQMSFVVKLNADSMINALKNLPKDDAVRYVIEHNVPKNKTMLEHFKKRFKSCRTIDEFVLSSLKVVSKVKINEMFDFNVKKQTSTAAKKLSRGEQMVNLRKNKVISSYLSDEKLKTIVNKYIKIVEYRNSFNHAFGKTKGKDGNQSLKELILEELNLITDIRM